MRPRTSKALVVIAAVLVLWAVAGFLVLPGLLRPVLERRLAEALHRPVAVRGLSLNPFALSATVEGIDVKEKAGAGPFFSLERLYVNLEAASLFRGGPVIRTVTLTKPSVTVVRREDGSYNFQDLLDEAAKPKPAGKPLHFSVNNIRVDGGSVDFDDRPGRTKHTLRDVTIGIPFLSNIPSKVEITTRPVFEAKVNGAPFALRGEAKPFGATHETAVVLDLSDVDLVHYLGYLPASIPSRLTAGRLDAKIRIAFAQPPAGTSALVLSGRAALRRLSVEKGGEPLFACDGLEAVVDSFDVFGRKVRVRSLTGTAPEVWVRRGRTGGYNLASALAREAHGPGTAAKAPMPAEAAGPAWLVEIGGVQIVSGRIHYDDLAPAKPFRAVVGDVAISAKGYSTAPGKAASVELSAKTDAGETLKGAGTITPEPFALDGSLEIGGLPLRRYAPYYERLVRFVVDDGVLDLGTKCRFSSGPKGETVLSGLTATLRSPRLTKTGEKKPFFDAPSLKLGSSTIDFGKREAALGELSSAGGMLAVVRDKEGNADLTQLAVEAPPAAAAEPPAPSPPWTVALEKLALDGYTIRVQDFATEPPARYALTKTDLSLADVSTASGKKGTLSVRFGIDGRGIASAKGAVGIHPTYADLKADVKGLDLVPLEPYILSSFNLSLARARLSGSGRLTFRDDPGGRTSVGFAGNATVADLLATDPSTKLDFFKWEKFSLEGTKAGYNPTFLEVRQLAVSGVACDVVVEGDGTVNLAKVLRKPAPAEAPAESAAASVPPPAQASSAPDEKVPIHIDTLVVQGGRIGLADHFVRPNYAATLADVNGRITGLSTDEGSVAQLELRGSLANHSPLEISGRINPLAATAFADVRGTFRGIDLPPFTPYSGKYAGYAIARGTLTMEVAYKLQNRKLAAENRFLVDQFEFGEKVESKDATKLPVRLAVSLLRDRNGLIDLDLPIEGSLDDPKFRLGKVIWQVLGNLIGKAATAPFALLGKLLGGKSEEMSSVDFADGRETLDDAAKKKLDALAKALNDRPALKLEAAGRFSGEKDSEGLRRLRLERKVKAQKLAELSRKGEAPASVDAVVVDEKEYASYLEKAYKREKFKKPRGALGFAKDLPAPEMESLMLENLPVTADDLRQLALARANSVKDYLTGPGKVDGSRVFVTEPASEPASPAGKAGGSRVDFVLK